MTTVAACVPVHPPNITNGLLNEALASVWNQTRPVDEVHVAVDTGKRGAWHTRQRALDAARANWVAFLDSDDLWAVNYLERMLAFQEQTGADYLFAWFDTQYTMGADPLGHFGKPFNPAEPHHTTMTVVVRRELAQAVGFTPPHPDDIVGGEDWRFTLGCVAAGAKIMHLPERLWYYRWWGGNTAGRADQWGGRKAR